MAPPKGSAAYKKRDGTLALAKDSRSVSWAPLAPPSAPPSLVLPVSSITNLQQTPASSAKVMLKIFAQPPDAPASETHIFSFTSPNAARAEADAIKDALSTAIQASKATPAAQTPAAAGGGGGPTSAAMAIASAVSSTAGGAASSNGWYEDAQLKSDVDLQQSLLKSDPSLQKTFMESLRLKPDSITNAQFTNQFWSTRMQLLRAHAIEKNQMRGQYNVLSTIKAKTEDNVTRLSISKEQIQLIFTQHPLVKRVYDETVPRLNESAFWSKFFQSRLLKKLKGEKITEGDPLDPDLDKYLNSHLDLDRSKRQLGAHIPHIIDVEGNEENHSQRKGNQPDWTMRPQSHDKIPVIRTLNELSERIMAQVEPADVDPSEPIGMDEETYNELALRDLQGDAEENRIILNIKDQRRFFASDQEKEGSAESALYSKQKPAVVLTKLRNDLDPFARAGQAGGGLGLQDAIGVDEDSESEDEQGPQKHSHVGSRASLAGANKQMLDAIAQRRSQTDDFSSASTGFSAIQTSTSGLSTALFDRLVLTHATSTEFLHHFWIAFLSGDPDRAGELATLAESLKRAIDRIQAVAIDAEKERSSEVDKKRREVRDRSQATGKKLKFNSAGIGGGSKAVNEILGPTVKAIGVAVAEYKKALMAEGMETDGPT